MPIKSFRNRLASGSIDQVSLKTNSGATGYRIKKISIIGEEPGQETVELVLKIYKIPQPVTTPTSVDNAINFSDNTLLGVAYYVDSSSTSSIQQETIIFDNEVFNQDIFITAIDTSGSNRATNYYMELEQVKLDLNENTVATLKDIRNIVGNV
jgi:hypothetical protein